MSEAWNRLKQRMYPSALRIEAGAPDTGLLILELASVREMLAALETKAPPADPPPATADRASQKVDENMAVAIGNHMLRLERSATKARQQGSAEAERLQGHLERMKATLADNGVKYEDLTGQPYDSGRVDFEPMGEPQPRPDLRWPTIIQCERPVVLLNGKLAQKAKGVVGTPAH